MPVLAACGGSEEHPPLSGTSSGSGGTTATGGAGGAGQGGAGQGGGQAGCEGLDGTPGDYAHTIASSGEMREFRVHVPPGYDPGAPTMTVLVFHGYTETSEQIEAISEMTPVSDARGFLAVYPQGLSNSWNAGSCCGSSSSQGVDDVQFVRDMLDALAVDYCVDPKRVFSAGFSNGGMLSHRLACELSDRIAAIGPVAGTMAIDGCAPARAVPVLHVHGTADFVVPYDGGGLSGADSVDDTIAGWVARNGCTDAQPSVVYQNGDATCEEHSQCDAQAAVQRCTIDGGGHQWPGGTSAGPAGELSMDLESSEAMEAFFEAHPMP
jgi:polyhydroxybutyrate depolymerase